MLTANDTDGLDLSWGNAGAGTVPAPPGRMRGSGIMNALFSALRGGPSAARFASEAAPPEIDYEEEKRFKKDIFPPQ